MWAELETLRKNQKKMLEIQNTIRDIKAILMGWSIGAT